MLSNGLSRWAPSQFSHGLIRFIQSPSSINPTMSRLGASPGLRQSSGAPPIRFANQASAPCSVAPRSSQCRVFQPRHETGASAQTANACWRQSGWHASQTAGNHGRNRSVGRRERESAAIDPEAAMSQLVPLDYREFLRSNKSGNSRGPMRETRRKLDLPEFSDRDPRFCERSPAIRLLRTFPEG